MIFIFSFGYSDYNMYVKAPSNLCSWFLHCVMCVNCQVSVKLYWKIFSSHMM